MVVVQSVWWLLVLIGVMILIHELGHYWAARIFDVRVDAFSFGFGPRLFGFRRGETDFRFSLIPFGGYVKMAGELPGDETATDPRAVLAKPRWQRLIIAFAGPFMNIVLAVALVTGLFMVKYAKSTDHPDPVIGYVAPTGAAAKAGIHAGDEIVQIDDKADPNWEDVAFREVSSANRPLTVWVKRNGERMRFNVTPVLDNQSGLGFAGWDPQMDVEIAGFLNGSAAEAAGVHAGDILQSVNGQPVRSTISLQDIITSSNGAPIQITVLRNGKPVTVTVSPKKMSAEGGAARWMIGVRLQPRVVYTRLGLPDALGESVRANARSATFTYKLLKGIMERRMSPKTLSGPIGISDAARKAAQEGALPFLELMAMVSLQLAIFNLLPIPILDGGVILTLLIEMLLRRDLSMQVKEAVFKVGFVFLMMVVAFVIYNDISKIIPAG